MIRIGEESIHHYVVGSLHYSGIDWRSAPAEVVQDALTTWSDQVGLGRAFLPPFLAVDLAVIFHHGVDTGFPSPTDVDDWSDRTKTIMARYQNELLDSLIKHPGFQDALDIVKSTPAASAQLLDVLLRRFSPFMPGGISIHPPVIRRWLSTVGDFLATEDVLEHAQLFERFVEEEETFIGRLENFLNAIAQNLRWSTLLGAEDNFELRHWDSLRTEFLRIGCRQILELDDRLGELDIRGIRLRPEPADAETEFVDESHFPAGGFAGLTNRGSFENMVLSELVYMSRDESVSLFDLRYVEGELMFYLRDEGLLRRRRRTVHLIIDLGEFFHVRAPGYDYQFAILVQGIVVRLIRDLLTVFTNDSVQAEVHYLYGELELAPIANEMELLKLLLDDDVQHDRVQFHFASSRTIEELERRKRKPYAIVFAAERAQWWEEQFSEADKEGLPITGIVVHTATQSDPSDLALPMAGLPFESIVDVRDSIVQQLVG